MSREPTPLVRVQEDMNASSILNANTVAIASVPRPWTYADAVPYLPDRTYPELQGKVATAAGGNAQRNVAYELVRQAARQLGLDAARYGTPDWNPFGDIVRPGDSVVIKPNLVRHFHHGETFKAFYQQLLLYARAQRLYRPRPPGSRVVVPTVAKPQKPPAPVQLGLF